MAGNNIYPSRDFSDNELKISTWITSHFRLFQSIGVGFLVFLDIVFVGLFLYGMYIYVSTYKQTENAINLTAVQEIDWPSVRLAIAPDPLIADSVTVLSAGTFTDFVSRVTNTNENKWGEFEYRFIWIDGSTEWNKAFVLPNDAKYTVALGIENSAPASVRYEIQNMTWHTIDKELEERYDIMKNSIVIVDTTFVPNVNKELTGVPSSGVEFIVENRSPFNLQDISFNVLLSNGANFTAANRATLSKLDRGQQRLVRTRWFRVVGGANVIIEPDINYLDDDIIRPFIDDAEDALF